MHCYRSVEMEAKVLFGEYFYQDGAPVASIAPVAVLSLRGFSLDGSTLRINCAEVTEFPTTKVQFDSFLISGYSHLFIEGNKSFTNFLQRNRSNVTHFVFSEGSLQFDSLNKILQKIPDLNKIQFNVGAS